MKKRHGYFIFYFLYCKKQGKTLKVNKKGESKIREPYLAISCAAFLGEKKKEEGGKYRGKKLFALLFFFVYIKIKKETCSWA